MGNENVALSVAKATNKSTLADVINSKGQKPYQLVGHMSNVILKWFQLEVEPQNVVMIPKLITATKWSNLVFAPEYISRKCVVRLAQINVDKIVFRFSLWDLYYIYI